MVCQKLNRALTYQMSRGAHVHVSNEWKWVTWYKNITTGSLSSEYYKLYSVANVDDLTWFNSNRTTHHNKWLSIILDVNLQCLANQHPVWRVIIYCDESFNSSWIVSIRQHLQPPPSQTLAEYFLSVLQIDIQYDGSSFVVTSCSIQVNLCQFNNIFYPLSQTLVEYFLSLLQIDFQYAFSCHKRWFLRPPVSQHH